MGKLSWTEPRKYCVAYFHEQPKERFSLPLRWVYKTCPRCDSCSVCFIAFHFIRCIAAILCTILFPSDIGFGTFFIETHIWDWKMRNKCLVWGKQEQHVSAVYIDELFFHVSYHRDLGRKMLIFGFHMKKSCCFHWCPVLLISFLPEHTGIITTVHVP